jgi:hypothetical protein
MIADYVDAREAALGAAVNEAKQHYRDVVVRALPALLGANPVSFERARTRVDRASDEVARSRLALSRYRHDIAHPTIYSTIASAVWDEIDASDPIMTLDDDWPS